MLVAEGSPERVTYGCLVVDGNEVLGNGLRWLLTRVPWVQRCALSATSLRRASTSRSWTSASACRCASASPPPARRTALLASRWDDLPLRTARAAGAHGVIATEAPARELLAAVRELACGGAPEPAVSPAGRACASRRVSARSCGWSAPG